MAPQQSYSEFNDITFNSKFDSGNLMSVEKAFHAKSGPPIYHLYVANDAQSTPYEKGYRGWFYFQVTSFHLSKEYTFIIKNITGFFKLLQNMPIVWSKDNATFQPLDKSSYSIQRYGYTTELTFQFTFQSNKPHYFAFSHPYPYEKSLTSLSTL